MAELPSPSTPMSRPDAHATGRSVLDRNISYGELANVPGIGPQMAGRPRRRKCGNAGRERQRQQQLIGEMKPNRGIGSMVLVEGSHCFIGNGLGRLTKPAIAREACRRVLVLGHKKNARARPGCGNAMRQDIDGDTKVPKRCPRSIHHALWNVSGQVCGDSGAGDLPQRAAVHHLDRIEPRSAAVDSDLTRDLAVADRIPSPSA